MCVRVCVTLASVVGQCSLICVAHGSQHLKFVTAIPVFSHFFKKRRYGRLEEDVQLHAHLQQPWQALHAATVVALDAARRASRPPAFTSRKLNTKPLDEAAQPKPWTTARIMGKVVRLFAKTAQNCLQQAVSCREKHPEHYREFHKAWIASGIATHRGGKVRTHVLANWRNPQNPDPDTPTLVFATDGSAQKGQAGWGYVARRTTRGNAQADTDAKYSHADALTRETGRVVTNPSQPEYLGATKATNNTGKLSAIHHALSRAASLR